MMGKRLHKLKKYFRQDKTDKVTKSEKQREVQTAVPENANIKCFARPASRKDAFDGRISKKRDQNVIRHYCDDNIMDLSDILKL